MDLPTFPYHPDPIATGSVRESEVSCASCGQARGFIYVGPVYAEEELADCLCPWCIADGSAHRKFGATFTDDMGIGGYGDWDAVPADVVETVSQRTPGFGGWQQERWWTHCGDAAAFLGRAGWSELSAYGPEALAAFADERYGLGPDEYLRSLDRDRGPTAYVFRCRHCGKLGGFSDCH